MGKEFEIGGPIAYYPYGEWTPLCDCQGGSLYLAAFLISKETTRP